MENKDKKTFNVTSNFGYHISPDGQSTSIFWTDKKETLDPATITADQQSEGEKEPLHTDKLFKPYWVEPAYLETLGYKDDNHADGADAGYFKYVSHGGKAKHREGRECEQILWDGKRQIWFNCTYAPNDKAVYCKIYEDAGTRTVFNGVLFSPEQLNLVLNLVE